MNTEEFDQLCVDACVALGLPDPSVLRTQGQLEVDGVDIALLHDAEDEPGSVFSFADLGYVEPAGQTEVFQQLLALNFSRGSALGGFCGLHQSSQHAVLCVQIDDADLLDGDGLARLLREQAADAARLKAFVTNPLHSPLNDETFDSDTPPPSQANGFVAPFGALATRA